MYSYFSARFSIQYGINIVTNLLTFWKNKVQFVIQNNLKILMRFSWSVDRMENLTSGSILIALTTKLKRSAITNSWWLRWLSRLRPNFTKGHEVSPQVCPHLRQQLQIWGFPDTHSPGQLASNLRVSAVFSVQ